MLGNTHNQGRNATVADCMSDILNITSQHKMNLYYNDFHSMA